MAPLLDRFLRGGRGRAHAEGMALLEDGRYAEAVACLREAAHGRGDAANSIVAYHFRQALVAEGRRLLRSGDAGGARSHFAEAAELWPVYPDLHWLLGAARAALGAWEGALSAARAALRINADYIEARLLEAASLQAADRRHEAADALNALLESGRRADHWLVGRLARKDGWKGGDLPDNLAALVAEAAAGVSEKEEVAAAVALCRAGHWDEGLERFASLVERRPRYPDYRTRHAAALFQLGRNDEALAEVEAALALNEAYGAASDLKALILADGGRLAEARAVLAAADARGAPPPGQGGHEALFGSYLRSALALMLGRSGEAAEILAPWHDLPRSFARAELLLAAADDLAGRPDGCRRRLETLAEEWPGESVYCWLLAAHHLQHGRAREAAAVLGRWPRGDKQSDWRPLFLEGHLAVDQGRVPAVPEGVAAAGQPDSLMTVSGPSVGPEAWRFLAARAALLQGDAARCLALCAELATAGTDEGLELLRTRATAAAGQAGSWQPVPVLPAKVLLQAVPLLLAGGREDEAAAMLAAHARLHPHEPAVCWLSAEFWFAPIRSWIG
jgi:tetratricopeptide (TPR) repeat protein